MWRSFFLSVYGISKRRDLDRCFPVRTIMRNEKKYWKLKYYLVFTKQILVIYLHLDQENQMPIDRRLYPKNWQEIALAEKSKRNWRCQRCGKHCYRPGEIPKNLSRSE